MPQGQRTAAARAAELVARLTPTTLAWGALGYAAWRLGSFTPSTLGIAGLAVAAVSLISDTWAGRRATSHPIRGAWMRLWLVVGLSTLVFLLVAQPFGRPRFDLAVGLAAGGFGLAGWLARWARSALSTRQRAAIVLGLFYLTTIPLLLEVALFVVATVRPSPLLWADDSLVEVVLRQNRLQPGEMRFGFPANQHGHYDTAFTPREDGAHRIAMIGDSFGVGVVPHRYHYTTVAEDILGVPLDSFGVPAAGPYEYLALLRHDVLPLRPSAVVISLFLGNDLRETARRMPKSDRWLRRFFGRDGWRLVQVPRRWMRARREQGTAADAGSPEATAPIGGLPGEDTTTALETDDALATRYPWLRDPALEPPTLLPDTFRDLENERARDLFGRRPRIYEVVVQLLVDARELAGVPVLVVLIPDEFQVEDDLWNQVRVAVEPPPTDPAAPQRRLLRMLVREGFPVLDLLPRLRAVPPNDEGKRHLYHLRDTHWNRRGNRVAGVTVARWLARELPFVSATDRHDPRQRQSVNLGIEMAN